MTTPTNNPQDDFSSDDESLHGDGSPLDSPGSEESSGLMESTVDSIEEAIEQALHDPPSVSRGKSADETNSDVPVGEATMPFGIDLLQTIDQSQIESTQEIDQPSSPDAMAGNDADPAGYEDTHTFDQPPENDSDKSEVTVSLGTGKTQQIDPSDRTVSLDDTADQNAFDATLQFGSGIANADTVIPTDDSTGGTAVLDHADIGQTVNPRELSDKDAAFWGSLLQSGTGKTASRGDVTEVSPAIERSISETKLQIRVRDMVTPKQSADAESDYRLVQLLGKGGMGNVFVAKQTSLDRLIAVKVIKPLDQAKREKLAKQGRLQEVEEDRRQQFLSEAVVTGDLDHPNIVPIHDVAVTADNTLFYSMKRVVGTPWSKVIKEKSRDENLEILLRVSDAIGFAHTRGVVHRDIKPENIMLGDFGVVLVMDWGLALAKPEFEKIDSISHTAGLGGTPAFMAPEMATGPMEKIGPVSDIYLLGATLFLIITGRPPHQAPNISMCIKAVAKNEITGDLESHRGELLNIAIKAMAKDPRDRYADVPEFQSAIRQYRSHAESIALATRADEDARQGVQHRDYTLLSRATYGYEEALTLWSGNEAARDGLHATKIGHANAALQNEDFDLGLSLLNPDDPDHQELIDQLHEGQRERSLRESRLKLFKRVAMAMLAFILVGGAIAFYFINDQRNKAIAARSVAEQERQIASEQRKRAEEKTEEVLREQKKVLEEKARADKKTIEAENNLDLAEEKKKEADENAATAIANGIKAEQNAARAEKNANEAIKQRGLAEKNAEEARREQEKAEYETYLSQIGLVKARIERNEFDDARRILKELKEKRGAARLGWEWRWLSHQANQSAFDYRTKSAIVDLSLAADGTQGVAVLDDGTIQLVSLNESGDINCQSAYSPAINAVGTGTISAAAISARGDLIAVGRTDGNVEIWDASLRGRKQLLTGHQQRVSDIQFSPNGGLLSASMDRTVRYWNPANGNALATLWHIAPVRKVAVAMNQGELLVATAIADGNSGRAVVWRLNRSMEEQPAKRIGEFAGHNQPLASIALSPDGSLAASGDSAGNVLLWRSRSVKQTDYQSSITDAIKKTSGKLAQVRSASSVSSKMARLVDPSIDSDSQQLVSAPSSNSTKPMAHNDNVESIAFSNDGNRLLTTAHDYTIKIWDVPSRKLTQTLRGHGGWVTDATFVGEKNDHVLSVSKDASIRSWNTQQQADANTLIKRYAADDANALNNQTQPHEDEIWSARFGPTGSQIVSASRDHTARVLDIDRDTMAFRESMKFRDSDREFDPSTGKLPNRLAEGSPFRAMSVAVDRANGRLFVGSADATVRIWDLVRGTQLGQISGTGLNQSIAISANGRLLLTGSSSADAKAILWGIDPSGRQTPRVLYRLKGHEEAVTAIAISPNGRTLFTGDRIGLGYLWDAATGQQLAQKVDVARGFRINDACFSRDGKELLVASDDQTLTRINVALGSRLDRFKHDGFVTKVSLADDDQRVLTISESSTKRLFKSQVTLWNLATGKDRVLDQIQQQIETSASKDGEKQPSGERSREQFLSAQFGTQSRLAVISRSTGIGRPGILTVVDMNQGSPRKMELPRHLGPAEVAMPLTSGHLVTLNSDAAFLWDMNSMTHRISYRAHAALTQASFSFDSRFVATGSRSVKVWDAKTGSAIGKLESPHQGAVTSVQFRQRGPDYRLATAGEDGWARVWRWDPANSSFTKLHEFALSAQSPVVAKTVCFSPDGQKLLAAGDGGRARIWSLAKESPAIVYDRPQEGAFTCCDFSPDGKWFVLGSSESRAELFPVVASTEMVPQPIVFEGHADRIEDVAIIQDSSHEMRVLTASQDKSARLWDPRIGSPDSRAREILSLRKHTLGVTAVDVTRDGDLVMTASRDGSVILWPAAPSKAEGQNEENLFDDLHQDSR
ncbi:MAG: protein kinase [Pirellulaceae bacterium]